MGLAKVQLEEIQERKYNYKLANLLGLEYKEMLRVNYRIDTEESNDGFLYNYIIEFDDDTPRIILKKIKGIQEGRYVKLASCEIDFDDHWEVPFETIKASALFSSKFHSEIVNLQQLSKIELDNMMLDVILKKQIFCGVIVALETFLSELFIFLTLNNEEYFRNFIETFPYFKKIKIELRDLYNEMGKVKIMGEKVMKDINYHDLPKVSKMFTSTFKIDFPPIKPLMNSIEIRNDLIHRSGKTKNGNEIFVNNDMIDSLMEKVDYLVQEVSIRL